jgi:hypothetical protein
VKLWNVEAPTIIDDQLTDGNGVVSPWQRPLFTLVLISARDLVDPSTHSAAGGIRSVEKFSDLIRN